MPSASESPAPRRIAGPAAISENGLSKWQICNTFPPAAVETAGIPAREMDLVG